MAHVVIVGAVPESLVNFRGKLIQRLIAHGHRVTAMAGEATPDCISSIEALGASYIPYPVNRTGRSVAHDLRTFKSLRSTFFNLRPDLVMAYTIKPVVWGGLAARTTGVPKFYALIEGLGYAFQGGSWRRRLVEVIARSLYFVALRKAIKVIFLNPDNRNVFISKGLIRSEQAAQIDGIGVDLDYYRNTPIPPGNPIFLCIARLLGDKGLREYAEAAKRVHTAHPNAQIRLLGAPDASPDGIPLKEVMSWHNAGILEYLGETRDVRPVIEASSVFILPSYHEGLPRTTLEAMSMGRPVITTDVPGCRETVVSGENGFLIPKQNVDSLVEKMVLFIQNPETCRTMGAQSRRIAERRFDVAKINADLMEILGLSGPRKSSILDEQN
jgi:glycosyltransferase involved in cell wall biosynthesis